MRDINFFSVYKVAKARTKDVTALVILGVLVLGGIVAGAVYLTGQMFAGIEKQIADQQAFIDADSTKKLLDEVTLVKKETELAEAYEKALRTASDSSLRSNLVTNELLAFLAARIPATTSVHTFTVSKRVVYLDCVSAIDTDPIDMMHALITSGRFDDVTVSSITSTGTEYAFAFSCSLKEEVPS